nr:hypothetical protein CFP56_71553 [Quercus suber]
MEGFFDGADVVAEAMAFASTAAQRAPAETPNSSAELGPIKEGAQTEKAVKDDSSLVVTPSSNPSYATHGPNEDMSSDKGFEDSDDEPTIKKKVSDSNEEESGEHETKAKDIPEEPETAADIIMPTTPIPATPTVPVSTTLTTPVSATPTAPTSMGPGPILTSVTAPSQFEVSLC